jgi:hypothetical protein
MQKRWPWICIGLLWLFSVVLLARAVMGSSGRLVGIWSTRVVGGALLLAYVELFVQLVCVVRWGAERAGPESSVAMPNRKAREYHSLGIGLLAAALICLDFSMGASVFDGATISALVALFIGAHFSLRAARGLALVPDRALPHAEGKEGYDPPLEAAPKPNMKGIYILFGMILVAFSCLYILLLTGHIMPVENGKPIPLDQIPM